MPPKRPAFTDESESSRLDVNAGAAAKTETHARQNLAMAVAYEGGGFQGWQVQPHGPTVQGKLEEVLRIVCGCRRRSCCRARVRR